MPIKTHLQANFTTTAKKKKNLKEQWFSSLLLRLRLGLDLGVGTALISVNNFHKDSKKMCVNVCVSIRCLLQELFRKSIYVNYLYWSKLQLLYVSKTSVCVTAMNKLKCLEYPYEILKWKESDLIARAM